MKKILLAVAALLIFNSTSFAAMTLSLAKWKGGTGADRYDLVPVSSINFGTWNIGATTSAQPSAIVDGIEGGLIIKCSVDNNTLPWFIKINDDFALRRVGDPNTTIPNLNFKYKTWKISGETGQAQGTMTILPFSDSSGNRYNTMTLVTYTLYTSKYPAENVTADTRIHLQMWVDVPFTPKGNYSNNIIITLTN